MRFLLTPTSGVGVGVGVGADVANVTGLLNEIANVRDRARKRIRHTPETRSLSYAKVLLLPLRIRARASLPGTTRMSLPTFGYLLPSFLSFHRSSDNIYAFARQTALSRRYTYTEEGRIHARVFQLAPLPLSFRTLGAYVIPHLNRD